MPIAPSILVIVHQETSNPGLVGDKLRSRGYNLDIRCPALGDALPKTMAHHAGAIVFGGPMSANDDDTLPFLRTELDWITMAVASGRPYLGICLGAQLLARVLGASVTPHPEGQREIGYCDLQPTSTGSPYFTTPMAVYHWHSEGFALPAGGGPPGRGGAAEPRRQPVRHGDAGQRPVHRLRRRIGAGLS